ncbi:hypothetical protein [Rurimicrobium arvi]|uniref:Uncharacterized protein n=1 Tax=Rurimicrobium arvi TaxID=2049916 RepID=A0ABP8MW12_9BACT
MATTTALGIPGRSAGLKDVLKQLAPMMQHVGGFVLGNVAINGINLAAKKFANVDLTDTTQKGMKRLLPVLPPVAVAAGSAIGSLKVDNPVIKNILQGAAIAGAYKTVKAALPGVSILAGDGGLGLTPVSAVSNTDRWLYHERTPVSGMGFPDLGAVQPPNGSSGYYIDAPAYMGAADIDPNQGGGYFNGGGADDQFYGQDDDLSGQDDEMSGQFSGSDDFEML